MANASWVCFGCREVVRRVTVYVGVVPCPRCGEGCRGVGTKVAVPRKRDGKGWGKLRAWLDGWDLRREAERVRAKVRGRHRREQEVVKLAGRPRSAGRERVIRALRRELERG